LISVNGLLVVLFELPLTGSLSAFGHGESWLGFVLIDRIFAQRLCGDDPGVRRRDEHFTLGEIISMRLHRICFESALKLRGRYMGARPYLLVGHDVWPAADALFSISPLAMWLSSVRWTVAAL